MLNVDMNVEEYGLPAGRLRHSFGDGAQACVTKA
jgi:hypothetical protein